MIADVAFDAPVERPFSYRIPPGPTVAVGQRVLAPLAGARRVGIVVAVRDGDDRGLKALLAPAEPAPLLTPSRLDLARWIASESLSSLGSTCAALLPPPMTSAPAGAERPASRANGPAEGDRPGAELMIGAGRERRLLEHVGRASSALVVVPDVEAAARWAQRLARLGPVVRLDSGVDEAARAGAWAALGGGGARLAVGTRSALLAPLASPGLVALVDEHEAAHKPPGPPRLHARDVVLERAARERLGVALTAATPSVEIWWRATDRRGLTMAAPTPGPWPTVTIADTRGILRREPLTPPLARAVREALAAGRRVLLVVSRLASALACDECGEIVRCPTCALALGYTRSAATLLCRLCATTDAAAGHLSALRGPPAVAVRLGPRAGRARRAPALPQGARGAVRPRGLARRARRRRSARRRPPPTS